MNLQFLGATDTVTGSKYLLWQDESAVLVDCGLFQGYKQLRLRNWSPLPVRPAAIDAVILTHAHIDHSGWLPLLVRNGFRGRILCTPATLDLCRILLPDSGHLQEEEANYANRFSTSKHKPALPLYTRADALQCLKQFHAVPHGKAFRPVPAFNVRMSPSGHMPGSAFVQVDNGSRSVLFSGDIGRPNDMVLKPPVQMDGADYLVVESTYGDRVHEASAPLDMLADVVNRTTKRGGVVVIPAFAVGRAQSLLHCLRILRTQGRIADVPVYLNSPMAASATAAYLKHGDQLRLDRGECEAMASLPHIVQTPEESEALNSRKGPMIIIAASGMATGGRVVHHLKAFAPDPRNTILLAGHQAGGTRGASILAGAKAVRIHGQDIPVNAEVASLGSLSAHADAPEIMQWLASFKAPPRMTFITHGEPAASDALRQRIERELHWQCRVPTYLETTGLL
ncbi:MBL fold metallo-hydrolase RNA specificity domain-containing protein [Caenimonas koreensis]|uniref:MBL fold metallo-hydrolase RNA specificity domain-containing protein n=1 Tax=Caenimonas koreensis TaxID=367474 RepID=UPI00378303B5